MTQIRTAVVSDPPTIVDQAHVFTVNPDEIQTIDKFDGNPPTNIGVEILSIVKPDHVVFKQQVYPSHDYKSDEPIATIKTATYDRTEK